MNRVQIFTFGPFRLVPGRQELIRENARVHIGARALDLLTALVERAGDLVPKKDLIARAWPSTTVDESNLKVNIAALRRALGDDVADVQYIATMSGRGYRFIAPVDTETVSELHAACPTSRSALPARFQQARSISDIIPYAEHASDRVAPGEPNDLAGNGTGMDGGMMLQLERSVMVLSTWSITDSRYPGAPDQPQRQVCCHIKFSEAEDAQGISIRIDGL